MIKISDKKQTSKLVKQIKENRHRPIPRGFRGFMSSFIDEQCDDIVASIMDADLDEMMELEEY